MENLLSAESEQHRFPDRSWKLISKQKSIRGWAVKQKIIGGERFISDDPGLAMAVNEMQSAAVTKGKSTHHASERSEAYVKRPLSTFQPGMPVEQDFAGKQKADVDVLSSATVPELLLRHREEEEVKFGTGPLCCLSDLI